MTNNHHRQLVKTRWGLLDPHSEVYYDYLYQEQQDRLSEENCRQIAGQLEEDLRRRMRKSKPSYSRQTMTHTNDQPINLTEQERKAIRSVAKKLDGKKRPSDEERDRNDSNDFDKGVRFG